MTLKDRSMVVTGAGGLIGSEVCSYFGNAGWTIHGIDNNGRADFFGPAGDTTWNRQRLEAELSGFRHYPLDIRDRAGVLELIASLRPDAIVHTAAQPSHDLAAKIPFDDFDTNAVGTLNLLEATRTAAPEAVFVHLSTNKVYGDAPNELPLDELATRWDYARPEDWGGIREDMRIDQSKHSLFGASKVAADIVVQEYARYFGLNACCLRGGCLTGPNHSGVELHGFLSYLLKCNLTDTLYRVYGYKGKQVRDAIHSQDLISAFDAFFRAPRVAEVYNIGGGRFSNASVLEAIELSEEIAGAQLDWSYEEANRIGDHIWWIGDNGRFESHYPGWTLQYDVRRILEEMYEANAERWRPARL
jgi:CDP-paratose 2-epimerase